MDVSLTYFEASGGLPQDWREHVVFLSLKEEAISCSTFSVIKRFCLFSGSTVKAGGKRVAKKILEEGVTHVTPEKDAKRSDKLRWGYINVVFTQFRLKTVRCYLPDLEQRIYLPLAVGLQITLLH